MLSGFWLPSFWRKLCRKISPGSEGVEPSRNLGVLPSNSLGGREEEEERREGGAWARLLPLEPREQAVPPASLATKIQARGEGAGRESPLEGL